MVSTAEMGVQTMNKQSENGTMPIKGDQNKAQITMDELDEQELNKVTGGVSSDHESSVPNVSEIVITKVTG
jgi:bacteriocin-like protein